MSPKFWFWVMISGFVLMFTGASLLILKVYLYGV